MCCSVRPIGVGVHECTWLNALFLLATKFINIFEGTGQMKEIIIVAGEDKFNVGWLRRCLREDGYRSIPCKTIKAIIEELNILPTCGVRVPLVIIEPEMLGNVSDDMVARLSKCAPDVPFVLLSEEDADADLMDVFEEICSYRMQFSPQQNSFLAHTLAEVGVKVTCG